MIYLFFSLFIAARSWERFYNPQILSEDGRHFLTDAYARGAGTILESYAGYFHTVPRIIAYIATLFPVAVVPWVLIVPCFVVFILLVTRFYSDDFSNLLKSKTERVAAGFLISLAPGIYEVFGNPTNIHWVLTLYLGVLCLRNQSSPLKIRDWILGSLAVLSGGECLALLPCFVWRAAKNKFKMGEIYFTSLILCFTLLNIFAREQGPGINFDFVKRLPSGLTYLFSNWMLLQPLMGDHLTHFLGERAAFIYWPLVIVIVALAIWKTPRSLLFFSNFNFQMLSLFTLSYVGLLIMLWSARAEAFGIFNQITRDGGYSLTRYSFLMGAPVLLLHLKIWPALFTKLDPKKWALGICGLTLLLSTTRFMIPAHTPTQPTWKEKLEVLKLRPCADIVSLEVWPEGWFVQIPRAKLLPYCPQN